MTDEFEGYIASALAFLIAAALALFLMSWPVPSEPRDHRCDTGARYTAMMEGADCS